jgi:hypothetical protein
MAHFRKDKYEYWTNNFFHVYSTYYTLELYGQKNLSNLLTYKPELYCFYRRIFFSEP